MPFTTTQIRQATKTIRLTWDDLDGDLNITFKPHLIGKAELDRLQALAERGEIADDEGLAPLLAAATVAWDFHQDDGTPYPITSESYSLLGYSIMTDIFKAMAGGPNPTKSRRSTSGSGASRVLTPIESPSAPSSSASVDISAGESMRTY